MGSQRVASASFQETTGMGTYNVAEPNFGRKASNAWQAYVARRGSPDGMSVRGRRRFRRKVQSIGLLNLEDCRRSDWVQSIGLLDLEDGRRSDWVESIGPLNLEDGRRSDWVESIGPLNLEDGRRSDWVQSIGILTWRTAGAVIERKVLAC